MTDDDLRAAYARHLDGGVFPGREGCPPSEALLALVERRGNEADRLATLDHAVACAACRRDLELLRAVRVAGSGRARTPALQWRSWRPAAHGRLAAAAVIVIAFGAMATWTLRRHDTVMRGGSPAPALVSPVGTVVAGAPLTLVWRAAPGVDRYDVELLSAAGDSLFAASTTDTAFTVPAGVTVVAGGEYLWTVRALLRDGSQAAAAPLRFRLRRP